MHDFADNTRSPSAFLCTELNLGTPSGSLATLLERAVRTVNFSTGETLVLEEGEVDNEILLTRHGVARLERILDGEESCIADLGPGDMAGEVHLLLGDAGTDCIVATESVEALAISRSALDGASLETEAESLMRELDRRAKAARLKAATPLSHLDGSALLEVAGRIEEEHVGAGSVLLAPDEAPERMVFLRAGRAAVLSGEGETRHIVADLLPGDSFGESVLLEGADESASGLASNTHLTIEATTDVELYYLDPGDHSSLKAPAIRLER